MDTGPDYSNIAKAITNPPKLSIQQQADNYNTFSKLMSDGVYIPDLLKRVEDLESKVSSMTAPKNEVMDSELFAVMESAVKTDDDVKSAKQRVYDAKTRVITELCMKDDSYRNAVESYRRAVNTAYVRQKERAD